jgi:hypothetical protein
MDAPTHNGIGWELTEEVVVDRFVGVSEAVFRVDGR